MIAAPLLNEKKRHRRVRILGFKHVLASLTRTDATTDVRLTRVCFSHLPFQVAIKYAPDFFAVINLLHATMLNASH